MYGTEDAAFFWGEAAFLVYVMCRFVEFLQLEWDIFIF